MVETEKDGADAQENLKCQSLEKCLDEYGVWDVGLTGKEMYLGFGHGWGKVWIQCL